MDAGRYRTARPPDLAPRANQLGTHQPPRDDRLSYRIRYAVEFSYRSTILAINLNRKLGSHSLDIVTVSHWILRIGRETPT